MRRLLAVPGYPRWLSARAVSWFGDTIMLLVLSIWVKSLTGSSALAGLTLAFFSAPSLLSPAVGFLIDRWSRRLILIAGNVVSAVAMLPLLWVRDASHAWILFAVTFCYGVSAAILPAASMALQRTIVPDDLLAEAGGLQQLIGTSFQLVCPALGAWLFASSGGLPPTLLAIVMFSLGALLFWLFRDAPDADRVAHDAGLRAEMAAGLAHVWRTKVLLHAFVASLLLNAAGGFVEGSMYSVVDTFTRPAAAVGFIALAQGVGMVVGALAGPTIIRALGEVPAMGASLVVTCLVVVGAALAPTWPVYLACALAAGLCMPVSFVAFGTLQQKVTPAGLMGRVVTATGPLYTVVTVLAMGASASLVTAWSYRQIYPVVAALMAMAALYLLLTRAQWRRPSDLAATPAGPAAR